MQPKRNVNKTTKDEAEEYSNPMFEDCEEVEQGEYGAIIKNIEEVRGDNTEEMFIEITLYIKELKLEHIIKYMKARVLTPNFALARFKKYYNKFPEIDMEVTAIVGDKSIFIKTRD